MKLLLQVISYIWSDVRRESVTLQARFKSCSAILNSILKFDLEVLSGSGEPVSFVWFNVTVYEDYGSICFQVFSSEMPLYVL